MPWLDAVGDCRNSGSRLWSPPAIVLLALLADGSKTGYGYSVEVTLAVAATAVVIVAALSPGPLQRSLSFAPIVWLGVVSYGLYLWQGVVFTWAGRSLVTVVVSILIAVAKDRYVETPLRRRRASPVPSPAPAAA